MRDENCIFCKIMAGEIPSRTLFEDDDFKVIMDVGPAAKGHSLIVPKQHYADVYELPGELAGEAMKLAKEANVDLVKIAPSANPPVCKLVNYGKYRYELARKEKEAKKKQKTIEVKEVRLSPNIDENDLNTKMNNARKFLEKGNKVKVTLRFRGREMAHMNSSKHILDDIAKELEEVAVVEKAPKVEGRSVSMVLAEKK